MYTEPFCVISWWWFHLSITQYIIAGALTDERSNFDGVIRSYTISKFIQELIPLAIPRTPDKVLLIQENIPSIIGSCPFFSWKGTKTHHAWKEWWWVTYVWMQDSPKYLCGVHQSQMWPILWEAFVLWMFYITYFDTFSKYRYMYKWTFVSLETKCEFKTCPELPSPHTKPIHGWLFKTINQTLHWNLYNRFNGLIGKIMIISKFSNKYLPQSQRIQVFFWFPRISEGAITLPLY